MVREGFTSVLFFFLLKCIYWQPALLPTEPHHKTPPLFLNELSFSLSWCV